MTDREVVIEAAYRQAVAEMSYSSISVKLLCARAGISRKVFYKHFRGRADVLLRIFNRDIVQPQLELCRLFSFEKMSAFAPAMEVSMFRALHDDAEFYRCVVESPHGGREAFADAASTALGAFDRILLSEFGFSGTQQESEYVAAFFADAKTCLMLRWIEDGFAMGVDEIADLYVRMALPFWRTIVPR